MNTVLATINKLPRFILGRLPTPLEEMQNLTKLLGGPRLFVKRDDQLGLALAGNKTRKLEFLIADALQQGADTIVATGSPQSNFCSQTAAAAARAGLKCEIILGGKRPDLPNGNALIDDLCGATVHWTERDKRNDMLKQVAEEVRRKGGKPYVIPLGGSNDVGTTGYVLAMFELMDQLATTKEKIDHIVVASSNGSGGTQAGLVVGAHAAGFTGTITGVNNDSDAHGGRPFVEQLADLANATAQRVGFSEAFTAQDFDVCDDYIGAGYGVVGKPEREAVRLIAQTEGMLICPVYTSKAVMYLRDRVQQGAWKPDETVLFWNTGGAPTLFAYAEALQ
jgi:D-cysteine desulfhydrase